MGRTTRRHQHALRVTAASVGDAPHPQAARAKHPAATAPTPTPEGHRHVGVEVENPNDTPLHVWASRKHYDYDPATKVLSLWLTEHTPEPPPGIRIISDHPRTPAQVEVGANGRTVIDVPIPHVIRKRVPGSGGQGMSFTEERIDQIDRVDVHIQYADTPMPAPGGTDAAGHRRRLLDHGDVVQESITLNSAGGTTPQRQ